MQIKILKILLKNIFHLCDLMMFFFVSYAAAFPNKLKHLDYPNDKGTCFASVKSETFSIMSNEEMSGLRLTTLTNSNSSFPEAAALTIGPPLLSSASCRSLL